MRSMTALLKRAATTLLPRQALGYRVYRHLVRNEHSYLHRTGWLSSFAGERPVDRAGEAVPWMNYPVVRLLERRVPPDSRVFEFGSGHSTLFWARRVAQVEALEYDKAWFDEISKRVPANARVHFCPEDRDGRYCRFIAQAGGRYDVVVVDGRDRVNCAIQAVAHLSERGVIVLDDSDRERYAAAFEHLRAAGFAALSIEGLKPTGIGVDETTIFYRPGNCLGL